MTDVYVVVKLKYMYNITIPVFYNSTNPALQFLILGCDVLSIPGWMSRLPRSWAHDFTVLKNIFSQ